MKCQENIFTQIEQIDLERRVLKWNVPLKIRFLGKFIVRM